MEGKTKKADQDRRQKYREKEKFQEGTSTRTIRKGKKLRYTVGVIYPGAKTHDKPRVS